jgi:cyclophilin family peptidyl-prolyl cis-trans isomerase
MRMNWMIAALVAALAAAGCSGPAKPGTPGSTYNKAQQPAGTTQQQGQAPAAPAQPKTVNGKPQWPAPPKMEIDVNKQYTATLKTSLGEIKIELWPKESPQGVNNFVFLARQGFYDGLTFHRVIKSFMIQGGDPVGNGTGGPGYRFAEELPPKHSYEKGIVAYARTQAPNSQGSQFFICNGPDCAKFLDPQPNYTQFGKVVAGLDVLDKLSSVEVVMAGEPTPSKPKTPPVIEKVTIDEK